MGEFKEIKEINELNELYEAPPNTSPPPGEGDLGGGMVPHIEGAHTSEREKRVKILRNHFFNVILPPQCGKDLTDCNHNKKSLKQLIFYHSAYFPIYMFNH